MKTVYQSMMIVVISIILGMSVNLVHPHKVAITFKRPQTISIDDEELRGMHVGAEGPVVVNCQQVKNLIEQQGALLIDARLPEEYSVAHLPGAVNVSLDLLGEHIQRILPEPRERWIVTYCDGPPCEKSEVLAQQLYELGFTRVSIYFDGVEDWIAAGNETEKGI